MLLSFAVQFWTNWFTNSSFCRDTTWGCFKIRDTQKVNRSSEPLDLGAWKSWDTPGKLCFTTIPSYWGEFWVVYPRLWYESTLSNTPKTLRKVIPVKDFTGEQTEYWIKLGKLWVKIPLTKNGCMDHHAADLGNSLRIFVVWIWIQASTYYSVTCWMGLWKLYTQIAHVGIDARCPAMNIPIAWGILHGACTTLLQMKT